MIITPTETIVAENRRQEALAWAARANLITLANQPAPTATTRPAGRIRVVMRQAVAALVALVSFG